MAAKDTPSMEHISSSSMTRLKLLHLIEQPVFNVEDLPVGQFFRLHVVSQGRPTHCCYSCLLESVETSRDASMITGRARLPVFAVGLEYRLSFVFDSLDFENTETRYRIDRAATR